MDNQEDKSFVRCSYCGCEYDSNYERCPQCGHKVVGNSKFAWILIIILAAINVLGFIYLSYRDNVFGVDNSSAVTEEQSDIKNKTPDTENNIEDGVDFGKYMRNMQKKIKSNWNPPKGNQSKRVVLNFSLDRKGKVLKYSIVQSSGVKAVDDAAVKALKEAEPFGNLPKKFTKDAVDVQFTFDYNVFKNN